MTKLLLLLLHFIFLKASPQVKGDEGTNFTSIVRSFKGTTVYKNGTDDISSLILELDDLSDQAVNYLNGILSSRIIPTAYLVTMLIGVPPNIVVIRMVCGKISTFSSAILYMSISVSNLLTLLTLPLRVHYYYNGSNWVFGETLCRIVTACFYGNIYCSIYLHMCISFKRYLAVVHRFAYKSLPRVWPTIWASLIAWAVFLIAMAPELLVRQSYHLSQLKTTTCHDLIPPRSEYYTFLLYYKLGLTCLGFFLPFLVTIFSYVSIVKQLTKSYYDRTSYIKICTLVFTIFAICFTPSNVFHFLHYMNLQRNTHDSFFIIYSATLCLCSLHCCLDPILFFLWSRMMKSSSFFTPFKRQAILSKESIFI